MSIWKNGKLVAGGSQALPLLTFVWADHKFNDVSWLRADTFSWQRGAMYQAAYQHLVDDINEMSKWSLWKDDNDNYVFAKKMVPYVGDMTYTNNTLATEVGVITATGLSNGQQTITVNNIVYTQRGTFSIDGQSVETIEGINVIVFVAKDGHKICLTLTDEESDIDAIYNTTGVAWYYLLDVGNQRFKLPRRHSQQIVRSVKNTDGSWYRLYADGWVEQGGVLPMTSPYGPKTVVLPVVMSSTNFTVSFSIQQTSNSTNNITYRQGSFWNLTTTSFDCYDDGVIAKHWLVSGQSATDMSLFQENEKHLYFYVGNFTQTALENTAGITAETLNDKVDKGHQVIEFQAPTSQNNYTWYRKYADGWVEQGGYIAVLGQRNTTITLPVEMADTNYVVQITNDFNDATNQYGSQCNGRSTTQIIIKCGSYSSGDQIHANWQVSGMAA